jgi:hypothetical protein
VASWDARTLLALGLALGAPACMPTAAQRPLVPGQPRDLAHVTSQDRQAAIRRGRLWQPTDVASLDLKAGPQGEGAIPFDTHVTCSYADPDDVVTGMTPKFQCALAPDDVVKVKYGRKNGEVYSEVVATRLFWALGFGADRIYPVQVTCKNCPIEPWYYGTEKRVKEKTYRYAAIERRLEGKKIEAVGEVGWEWSELDQMDEKTAPRAQRDALKLLMVFIQNSDNKGPQQRMVCPPGKLTTAPNGDEGCSEPLLYVNDLGVSFGRATLLNMSRVNLSAWEKVPIWKDPGQCVGHLKKSLIGTLAHPQISEAGRSFLAGLLMKLSDQQIRDLFAAARLEHRGTSLDDWVRVFKKKRAEIVDHRCPS